VPRRCSCFRPAHYLKKYHAKYNQPEEIAKSGKGGQQGGSWVQIYGGSM